MNLAWTYRNVKRLVVTVIGATVILIGIALLVLPGPGTVVIVIGLAMLATEWVWARRLLKRLKAQGQDVADGLWQALGFRKKKPESSPSPPPEADGPPAGSAPPPGDSAGDLSPPNG